MTAMKAGRTLGAAILALVALVPPSAAQSLVGALAVDERQGDQWGWAVDHETAATAQAAALRECGSGCSVVLTFGRCGAYAADQDADSTAVGWAETRASPTRAQQAALAECRSRGGSGCVVRVWGCNGQVIEEGLNLDRAARGRIQQGLEAAGFDPGDADGLFGPRTRAAIRSWQSSRGARATGYLDGAAPEALRSAGAESTATAADAGVSFAPPADPGVREPASTDQSSPPAATAELEGLFWQSIMNSTNPADFEAYLQQFPNGVFRALAQNRLVTLRESEGARPAAPASRVDDLGSPSSGSPAAGLSHAGSSGGEAGDARRRPGAAFQDCDVCPEVVVLTGGDLALGRYEVTVGEYRAFASATGGGAGGGCRTLNDGDSWRDPGFPQTDRHPVACVSWDDAQEYVSWLSRRTGATYRLPTEAEWERAAAGSQPGCDRLGLGTRPDGTCPVGSHGSNAAGLSDMVGNLWEWTSDCWEGNCGRRVVRGGSWILVAEHLRPGARIGYFAGLRNFLRGFRVSRTLD